MASSLPYYPMFVSDFNESGRVFDMSLAEVGLYAMTLNAAWKDGSIPNDPDKVALLIRKPAKDVRRAWDKVRACFEETAPGKLTNCRQEKERERIVSGKSTTRVQRFRERSRNGHETVIETPAETVLERNGNGKVYIDLISESEKVRKDALDNEAAFSLAEPWDWFRSTWPETVPNTMAAVRFFCSKVNTLERLTALRKNLPEWLKTRKFADGYVTHWQKFLDSDIWLFPPKPAELEPRSVAKKSTMLDELDRLDAEEKRR